MRFGNLEVYPFFRGMKEVEVVEGTLEQKKQSIQFKNINREDIEHEHRNVELTYFRKLVK